MNVSSDSAAGSSEAGQLRQLLALHEAALDSMAHGLCVVDAGQRVALFNARYVEMYNLAPETVRVEVPVARAPAPREPSPDVQQAAIPAASVAGAIATGTRIVPPPAGRAAARSATDTVLVPSGIAVQPGAYSAVPAVPAIPPTKPGVKPPAPAAPPAPGR